MVSAIESVRRVTTRMTHRIESLPILALTVHSACNCRCVMCDIWLANAEKRELTEAALEQHLEAIRNLRVRRVMLTGGEPLLHRNLWALCERLQRHGIGVTLITTGLLLASHLEPIAAHVDEVVVSIDGPPAVHDAIRRVPGGFARIDRGLRLLRNHAPRPRVIARSVIQRLNCARITQTIEAIRGMAVDRVSFLAADVSSSAFNRPQPWTHERQASVALSVDQLPLLAAAIEETAERCEMALADGFVAGGLPSLWRIHAYYAALLDRGSFPRTRCNAPWVSAVLEPDGAVRPCFFHPPYAASGLPLDDIVNSADAIAFRRTLNVLENETCRRCVCTLSLSPWTEV